MKKTLGMFACFAGLSLFAKEHTGNEELYVDKTNYDIYGLKQVEAIRDWGLGDGVGLGELFTFLQANYFADIFLAILILVPLAFLGHFVVIGRRKFNHHKTLKVFSNYNIMIHWLTAIPFMLVCITGLIMVFGSHFGGGGFVRLARDVHAIATCFVVIFGALMFFMWVKDALFKPYDIKWFMIMGGYMSKQNHPIPAGKFNAGQKMWFWIATLGGACMAITGGFLFFQSASLDTLRLFSIIHNVIGFAIIAFLIVHIYMAVFAIEGALGAIINGEMGEEELAILHTYYYEEIKKLGKA